MSDESHEPEPDAARPEPDDRSSSGCVLRLVETRPSRMLLLRSGTIVGSPGADMAEFRRYVENDQKFGRNIDKLFVVEEIPRGELGKVQRPFLREMLQDINNASAAS